MAVIRGDPQFTRAFEGMTSGKPHEESKADMINKPPHYLTGNIQVIDFIMDQKFDYLAGTVIKYIARYRHKGRPVEDLKKASWYLNRLISELETAES